jgi:hypothetical protein
VGRHDVVAARVDDDREHQVASVGSGKKSATGLPVMTPPDGGQVQASSSVRVTSRDNAIIAPSAVKW